MDTPNTSLFNLNLDANNGYTLRSAGSWAKVLGIVSIIMAILFIAMAVMFQGIMTQSTGRYADEDFGGGRFVGQIGMIAYIFIGLLYLISGIFSINFGNKITRALRTNDQVSLNSGFAAARNLFAFWAILMIIGLLFMLIAFASLVAGKDSM